MKKLITLTILLIASFTLSACNTDGDDDRKDASIPLGYTETESIATLSYLSGGFLSFTEVDAYQDSEFTLLANGSQNGNKPIFEDELTEVNEYLEQLKVFMDNGSDSLASVNDVTSDDENYENKLEFTVNEEVFQIYYNVLETGDYEGYMIIGDVTYGLEVEVDPEVVSLEPMSDEEVEDDTEVDQEEEVEEEADLEEDTVEIIRLTAYNGDDFVEITYVKETTEEETELKFYMLESKAGVEREVLLKFSYEEDEFKVTIKTDGEEYTFKTETEENATVYMLRYRIGDTKGFVKIIEVINEQGETVYHYQIKEDGVPMVNIFTERPERGLDDEVDEEPEPEEEEETGEEL